ncbi:MAG TPA: hypothetical protein VFR50_10700 [Casimicrobiaceae bacterium]|jgi:hypothetical protein|nr:hypothetical protein [Casimicrobiaceae bacterium]
MAEIPPPSDLETEHRLTAVETRLDVVLPTLATKADIAEVKAAMAALKSSLLVWGLTTAVAVVAILVSLLLFVAQQLQSAPSEDSASQPIVHRLPTLKLETSRAAATTGSEARN